ncbi:hypothetical protein QM797_13160 [Rhodococcus sp. IEGM 1381]|uniref:hypothetical protein n=1 Tax=Rhodococcus sp. IEGM 1381 TaxID=3047085 RepID=UPI0024B7E332|nr:hypothetical protein [Rhodococcus sp. IEGM 1381]MDI9895668.1 hypothetical protein [Rhodococcus sp. IEGM 1381]
MKTTDLDAEVGVERSDTTLDYATLVLASPRGRFFCANLGYLCSADERAANPYRPYTLADAVEVLQGVDVAALAELSESEVLDPLGFATDWARYWQPPDEEDIWLATPQAVAALRPIASAMWASAATQWWSDGVDTSCQRMVAHPYSADEFPESALPYRSESAGLDLWRAHVLEDEERYRAWRIERPDNRIGGEWWSIPSPSSALETTRARERLGALELLLEEDSSGCGEARVWPVTVRGNPRVYEIRTPADWARLVDTYPLAVPESKRSDWFETTGEYRDWFIPDWVAVANDFDAVHLTMLGYLTTPGIVIPLTHNRGATVLAGWNPDTTWWLNTDCVYAEDEPVLWRRDDEHWTTAPS